MRVLPYPARRPRPLSRRYGYDPAAAALREFPPSIAVWQASCLNCHDTHTVHGARRLAREGTDALGSPKVGGNSAIEETCYQCHSKGGTAGINPTLLGQGTAGFAVPDIKTDFGLPQHMPITGTHQAAGREVHDITNADFIEPQALLGKNGNLTNRHAECTDCHNPHRVMKNRLFNGLGSNIAGTHDHAAGHTNIASGVLRGAWGVEPVYGAAGFLSLPTDYLLKQGDGGTGAADVAASRYVTREYQICLKCHSDYGYDDDGRYPLGTRPPLSSSGGGTPSGTNDLSQYTNQAMEFQAPDRHKGEITGADSGAGSGFTLNNHRSWHPVIDVTGRSAAVRRMDPVNLFLSPWNGVNIGAQTMYCTDCHGSDTAQGTAVPSGGENGNPWGPHGSTNDFILKGSWSSTTGQNPSGICFKCHSYTNYATETNEGNRNGFESGFGGDKDTNLHAFHAKRVNKPLQCMWCHAAVPHGWKNKALLVNLNNVGPEAGGAPNQEVPIASRAATFTQGPYYNNAKLKVITFAPSGQWKDSDCGSASGQPARGREWMKQVCENPP